MTLAGLVLWWAMKVTSWLTWDNPDAATAALEQLNKSNAATAEIIVSDWGDMSPWTSSVWTVASSSVSSATEPRKTAEVLPTLSYTADNEVVTNQFKLNDIFNPDWGWLKQASLEEETMAIHQDAAFDFFTQK